jgi:hypothetical protein
MAIEAPVRVVQSVPDDDNLLYTACGQVSEKRLQG